MHSILIVLTAFIASSVEMVEAATIVLAIEFTRGKRAAYTGAASAALLLCIIVIAFSPLLRHIPLNLLRVLIGIGGLYIGFTWLRKAVLRASGHKAFHDEDKIFETERQTAATVPTTLNKIDRYGFIVAFKGVFIEGLEVVLIVLTLASSEHNLAAASAGAFTALLVVIAAAAVLKAPLSRVPENTFKYAVGILLLSFGTFWTAEGLGMSWPLDDASIVALATLYFIASLIAVRVLQHTPERPMT